ncbi:hypothetical protein GRX03_02445 [Halovenus sp. WSH3]|uniref:Uncharacterized protein n=1 Tax=Halovenus carboxidivorans TaxID=2692199 RepID=A0A6B0T2K5_9EURY|nr:hypothetical protein [Halovenus carboxidivorans]MXR50466.1 hypothetical protein [Halovenus carboxidivorans]
MGSVLAALRRRFSARSVVVWVATLAVVYLLTESYDILAGVAIAVAIREGIELLRGLPGVDERWVKVGFGVLVTAGSTAWLWLEHAQSGTTVRLLVPGLAVAAGLWLILDARADFVQGRRLDTGGADDDLSSAEAMLVTQHTSLVADELRRGPKTVDELAEACDLTPSRIRDVIDIAGQDGAIYAVDPDAERPRYALDEEKMGLSGLGRQAAGGVTGVVRRLVRPFTEGF